MFTLQGYFGRSDNLLRSPRIFVILDKRSELSGCFLFKRLQRSEGVLIIFELIPSKELVFRVERPRPPLGRTKDSGESRDLRCLFAKSFETWIQGQCYGYYFLYCVWNIFSFGVMEAFDSKGIINTLEKYYVSQLECVDLATFPFATWQIRSCLLCKFISTGACPLSFPSIFRSFRQENRIVELCSEIGRKLKSLQAKQRTCKGYVIGREITTY